MLSAVLTTLHLSRESQNTTAWYTVNCSKRWLWWVLGWPARVGWDWLWGSYHCSHLKAACHDYPEDHSWTVSSSSAFTSRNNWVLLSSDFFSPQIPNLQATASSLYSPMNTRLSDDWYQWSSLFQVGTIQPASRPTSYTICGNEKSF